MVCNLLRCSSVQVYAQPHLADKLEALYAETTRMAASEPGTIYYCISRDHNDPTIFHFFERYAGRAAFEAHVNQPIMPDVVACHRDVKAAIVKAIQPAAAVGSSS